MLCIFCTTHISSALQDTGKQGLLWNLLWPCLLQSFQTWAMSPPMADGAGQWCLEPPSQSGLHLPFLKLWQSTLERSRLFSASPTARLPGQHPSCVLPPTEEVSETRLYLPLERGDLISTPKREKVFIWESISLRKFLESANCKSGFLFSDDIHWQNWENWVFYCQHIWSNQLLFHQKSCYAWVSGGLELFESGQLFQYT